MEWSIHDISRLAGTTSRTLRHYGDVGLLVPSRVGSNGYRYYDERALTRLQRILLLRDLGLGLPAIAEVLAGQRDDTKALQNHLDWLHQEKSRLDRQITSVEHTIITMRGGEQLMAENMFDGFDHTQYKEEVEDRWGRDAYAKSDAWWRSMTASEKEDWMARQRDLGSDWIAAAASGIAPDSDEAQALAKRHFDWLAGIPGTPGGETPGAPGADTTGPPREYIVGLAEMYVADDRFAANYGGTEGATFVRDAMVAWADQHLPG